MASNGGVASNFGVKFWRRFDILAPKFDATSSFGRFWLAKTAQKFSKNFLKIEKFSENSKTGSVFRKTGLFFRKMVLFFEKIPLVFSKN